MLVGMGSYLLGFRVQALHRKLQQDLLILPWTLSPKPQSDAHVETLSSRIGG